MEKFNVMRELSRFNEKKMCRLSISSRRRLTAEWSGNILIFRRRNCAHFHTIPACFIRKPNEKQAPVAGGDGRSENIFLAFRRYSSKITI